MPSKPKVIVDPHYRKMDSIFSPEAKKKLYELADVVWGKDEKMPYDEAREAFKNAVAVIGTDWRYGDALEHAKDLRGYISVGGNLPQDFPYETAFAKNIRVLSCAPAFGQQVAEFALGLALAVSRDICTGDKAMKSGNEIYFANKGTFVLSGKPVGFIGYGGIARCLKPLLEPFHCPIAVYDPWQTDGYLRTLGVEPMGLEQLLETSRVIFVLAVPSTENQALLSRAMLEKIKSDSVLVLVSRAHVADFDALTELVTAGRFRAAIDVYPVEPCPKDHPIRQAGDGVVLQAHRAGSVREALWEIGSMTVDDLEAILRGIPPQRMQIAQPELVFRYSARGFHAGLA
jgi:phosphoglycerate dehydrogenase-like enzyme